MDSVSSGYRSSRSKGWWMSVGSSSSGGGGSMPGW